MPKPARRSMKDVLSKRLEGDYNRKKGGGSLFREDLRGVNFFTCKEGDQILDIIPYVAGDMDPIAPGEEGYVLEVFTHNDVGQHEGMVVCMSKTFKKPCPICEERKRLSDKPGADEDLIKTLTPSRYPRSIYNVWDQKDREKGVQVWHTSNYLMQQYLLELAKRPVRPGQKQVEAFIAFMDPDDGRSIAFKREGKEKNTKFIGIKFEERDYEIPQEILDKAYCLDDLVAWPTYAQVYEDFWGVPYEGGAAPHDVRDYEPVPERKSKEPEPEKQRREPEPEKQRREPEPELERKESSRSRREPEPDPPQAAGGKCPAGGKFGKDVDDLKECDKCGVWKDCARESDRLERESRKG